MKWFHYVLLTFIIIVYFVLRLSFADTIEFGYDQPRLASTVVDFLENGNFINSQNFSLESPWGNLSWGPVLVWFNSIFLNFSKDPIVVSKMMVVFNVLSILGVFYIGKRYFSTQVGLMSALILSVHPWWVIFSRMIYQPTPIPTFVVASLLLLFLTIEKPKSLFLSLLILSWGILAQSYLITFSFIFTSIVVLCFVFYKFGYHRKIFWFKSLFLGCLLNLILFLPSFYFYFKDPDLLSKFFTAGGKYSSSIFEVLKNYSKFVPGLGLDWQLGYAYPEFVQKIFLFTPISQGLMILFLAILTYGVVSAFKSKNIYFFSIALFSIAPLWMIPLIGVDRVVPRYFLYILPSLVIMISVSLSNLSKLITKIDITFCILFSFWSVYLIFNYFSFINSYSYPKGFLSSFSDVPFSYLARSFKWIEMDANANGFDEITISDNVNIPEQFSLNAAQRYYWEYIMGNKQEVSGVSVGHYLMYFSPAKESVYQQFGPYIVTRVTTKN